MKTQAMEQQMNYLQNALKEDTSLFERLGEVLNPNKSGIELLEDLAEEMETRDKKECWLCSELFNEDDLQGYAIEGYGCKQVCQTCIDKDNEFKSLTKNYEDPTDYRNK